VIASLFEAPVVTVRATEAMAGGQLHPDEAACIRRAVAKRRREFTAGRLCARDALAQLGIHDFPLLVGEGRVPLWPPGVVGSISHCKGYVGVAVARADAVVGLGFDVERAAPLEPELLARICTPRERERLPASPGVPDPGKLTFCAKESFYKCYFPLTRTFLGFQDVEVEFEPGLRGFRARLVRAQAPSVCGVRELEGRLAWNAAFVCSGVSLRAP
jgi:4'-phosphopantetheinyl transferase EntD